ncbi:MAG: PKD domain-containing protein [Actinomycetota bacterium]
MAVLSLAATAAPATIEVPVAVGVDDAEESSSGVVTRGSNDLELVFDATDQTVGIRFVGVNIPVGATVTAAWIQFTAFKTGSASTSLTVKAQAADSAPAFATAAFDISSRAGGSVAVNWDPAPWDTEGAQGPNERTPDLAPVVQQVISRPGWASGNAIAFIVTGTGLRSAVSFNNVLATPPVLHVEFVESSESAPVVTIQQPTDGVEMTEIDPIIFTGTATDPQDGDLSASLIWTSNRDGALGSGATLMDTLSMGVHQVTATATDSAGLEGRATVTVRVRSLDPVLVGAGDICVNSNAAATAALIAGLPGASVFTTGDNAYPDGTPEQFASCYEPTWGTFKPVTRPSPGNHDYNTPGAAGYFGYFGAAAGDPLQGYYSYDLGSWHLIALNSNCAQVGGCGPTSLQGQWLAADLAAHPNECTVAYWHHPLFSSGLHGSIPATAGLWELLYGAGADVVLAGHDHTYERFAPQDPNGVADSNRGIRQFIVGTGGAALYPFPTVEANSEFRYNQSHGVLALELRDGWYEWQFLATPTGVVVDSGAGSCVVPGEGDQPPVVDITSPPNGAVVELGTAVTFIATANDPEQGDLGGSIVWTSSLDGGLGTGAAITTDGLAAGSHGVTATVTDAAGSIGVDSITVTVKQNAAPTVSAGQDLAASPGALVTLLGTVVDDALPNPPGSPTALWSQVSGPGTVNFGNPNVAITTASFTDVGAYELRLEANDGSLSASDTVVVTVSDEPVTVIFEARVGSAIDDAEENTSGRVSLASSDLELVTDKTLQLVGMRWGSLNIPQGALITSAWVQFTADRTETGTIDLLIRTEQADSALAFVNVKFNISQRPRGEGVTWAPGAWVRHDAGPDQRTPDLSSIVQQVIDRPGWVAGNSLVLVITGSGKRTADSFDGGSGTAPVLHLEYTAP